MTTVGALTLALSIWSASVTVWRRMVLRGLGCISAQRGELFKERFCKAHTWSILSHERDARDEQACGGVGDLLHSRQGHSHGLPREHLLKKRAELLPLCSGPHGVVHYHRDEPMTLH